MFLQRCAIYRSSQKDVAIQHAAPCGLLPNHVMVLDFIFSPEQSPSQLSDVCNISQLGPLKHAPPPNSMTAVKESSMSLGRSGAHLML
eukprot:4590016-Amphidinium_carterae.2